MTHDRIKSGKKTVRFNVSFWVVGIDGRKVRLAAALETTSYGTGDTYLVGDSEGLFWTMTIHFEGWGQLMYETIKERLQCEYRRDQQESAKRSGFSVIPEPKLSTGKTVSNDA